MLHILYLFRFPRTWTHLQILTPLLRPPIKPKTSQTKLLYPWRSPLSPNLNLNNTKMSNFNREYTTKDWQSNEVKLTLVLHLWISANRESMRYITEDLEMVCSFGFYEDVFCATPVLKSESRIYFCYPRGIFNGQTVVEEIQTNQRMRGATALCCPLDECALNEQQD